MGGFFNAVNLVSCTSSKKYMKHLPINPQLFIQNRHRFVKEMKPHSIAIFNSNDEMPRNGDQNHLFRQNSDLLWMSGIDQEQTILVICPQHPLMKEHGCKVMIAVNAVTLDIR